jgi:class 3 adenylate cyclase
MVGVVARPAPASETPCVAGPSGTLTFLFTDIEDSTRLWESAPEVMRTALARPRKIQLGVGFAQLLHVPFRIGWAIGDVKDQVPVEVPR